MHTCIVRLILAILTLEAGICVAFLADDWEPLRHQEESLFEGVLALTRRKDRFVLDDEQPVSRVRNVLPLKPGLAQPYMQIPVDESLGDDIPPRAPLPEDWSLLLKHAHELGCEVAAIEQPLTFDGEDFLHPYRLFSIDSALALYDLAVLSVDLQRVGNPEPIPEYLRRTAIPLKNVRGEVGGLVRVHRVRLPPSTTTAPNLRFSYRVQESVEGATPAFVRWDDYLIPSFPLAVAMAQNNVTPQEVTIELGRHIRLGKGPVVPIDESGEIVTDLPDPDQHAAGIIRDAVALAPLTRIGKGSLQKPSHRQRLGLPVLRANPLIQLSADDLVLKSEIPALKAKVGNPVPRCAIFADATVGNPAPWADQDKPADNPSRLQRIVNSFDILPRPSGLEPHFRLQAWIELLLLSLVAVVAALLVTFPRSSRFLGFLALGLMILALLGTLFIQSQRWTPLAPVLAACLAGLLLSIRLARHLPPSAPVGEESAAA